MASVMLPPGLPERVSALVGRTVRTADAAVGGFSNLVFVVDDLVIKAARTPIKRADLQREAAILRVVANVDADLGAAPLVGASSDDQWALVATRHSPGVAPAQDWGKFVHSAVVDRAFAHDLGRAIGHRLRNIHAASPFPVVGNHALRTEVLLDAWAILTAGGNGDYLTIVADDVSASMIRALTDPLHERGAVFLHGDFGLHNLLIDSPVNGISTLKSGGAGLVSTVLDWELSGWGNPVTDLAWLAWALWFRRLPPEVWGGVVSAYGSWAITALGWNHEAVTTAILSQMAILIVRTEPESAVRDIWVDRARALDGFEAPEVGS